MNEKSLTLNGACHCKAVQFQVTLQNGFGTIRRCNCTYCSMRGAVAVSAQLADIKFTQGFDHLTLYQFNTQTAKHYFCSVCGVYTHHQRRSNPNQFGVNVACLENISPFDFADIPVLNGRNHPRDTGQAGQIVGHLHYVKEQQ